MNWDTFFYRISRDALISLLIAYFFLLIPELILPGIVSSHLSPKYVLWLVIVAAFVYAWLGSKPPPVRENIRFKAISKNLLNSLLVVITGMLVLSLYKMKIWQIAIVVVFSVALLISMQKMLLEKE
jgi:hypothetical protein